MLLKKAALLVCALLLVTAANLKLVYSVSVDGRALEGNWSRRSLENAQRAAYAAAEEVARGATALPEVETEARLSLLPARGDVTELTEAILYSAGGVERAWAVSAGFDTDIAIRAVAIPEGTESDLTELTAAIRGLARVYYVTPDGAQRYA